MKSIIKLIIEYMNCIFTFSRYILLTISLFSFNTFSQTENKSEIDSTYIKYSFPYEVKVTSSKYETELKSVSIPIELATEKEIFNNSGSTLSDILKNKAGISLMRFGIWATEISIRGMNKSNIVSLVDGNRIETSNDIAAGISLIELNDIKSIEVIKGSASSLYGSGAVGGVVNIKSNREFYKNEFNINGSLLSSYSDVNNNAASTLSINVGNFNWFTSIKGTLRSASDVKIPSGILNNSGFRNHSFSFDAGLKFMDNYKLHFTVHDYTANDVGIPGGNLLFPSTADVKYITAFRKLYSAEFNIINISKYLLSFESKVFYQEIHREVENIPNQIFFIPRTISQKASKINLIKILPTGNNKTIGVSFQTNWSLNENYFAISGIDIWERSLTSFRTRELLIDTLASDNQTIVNSTHKIIAENPLPDSKYLNFGFFIHNEIDLIINKLKLSGGGRIDVVSVSNEESYYPLYEINNGVKNENPSNKKLVWNKENVGDISWSSNLSIKYTLFENVDIIFSTARSFRSPSLEERFQYIDLGNLVRIGDPNLKPENGYFFDAGLRIYYNKLFFSGNLFVNYLDNLVTEQPGIYENKNALFKKNIGSARFAGFDFNIRYNIINSIYLDGNIAFVEGVDTENKIPLPTISPMNGIISIGIFPLNEIEMNFSVLFFADQNKISIGEIPTPGYTTFDLLLNSKPIKFYFTTFQFSTGIDNITNKDYRNHLSTNRGLTTSEPGRNYFIKLKFNW